MRRTTLVLTVLGLALWPALAAAQHQWADRVDVTKFTCREYMGLTGERRARALIYYNGYMDGRSSATVWEDDIVGARIDRVDASCKATPSQPLLDAFTKAWKP